MVTGTSKTVGIIGDPVAESLSPRMQNAAFSYAGLDLLYTAWQVPREDLAEAIQAIRACGIVGLNVTMPHKAEVIKYLDFVDNEAQVVDSVNTIVNSNGKLKGYTTDGEGFRLALKDAGYDQSGRSALIIGAGGAARAIGRALGRGRAKQINVACRNLESGQRLVEIIEATGADSALFDIGKDLSDVLSESEMVINATPLGKYSIDDIKFLTDGFKPEQFVADLSTVPPLSAFLAAAQERGCTVMGGLGMLVRQGSLSYKLWTGLDAPIDVMRLAVGG